MGDKQTCPGGGGEDDAPENPPPPGAAKVSAPGRVDLRPHVAEDACALIALYRAVPNGLGLSGADEETPLRVFLEANSRFCFALWSEGDLVGSVLAGTDWRRGYLYHLTVQPGLRREGFGTLLVEASLSALRGAGIQKVHAYVFAGDESAAGFWTAVGFARRDELAIFSRQLL
jgi:N-acetylglutamate synthase